MTKTIKKLSPGKIVISKDIIEKAGWKIMAEKSMFKMWNNAKDEETWTKYV